VVDYEGNCWSRLSKEAETKGTDVSETGVIAYAIRD